MRIQSSRNILSSISRIFKFSDNSWLADGVECIGDAVKGIGYHAGFEKRLWCLKVKNYCVDFPIECERVLSVFDENNNKLLPSNDLSSGIVNKFFVGDSVGIGLSPEEVDAAKLENTYESQYQAYKDALANNAPQSEIEVLRSQYEATLDKINAALYRPNKINYNNYSKTYSLDMGVIRTEFKEGTIKLIGIGFKIDAEGFPYVIDEFNYTEALKFFTASQLMLGGYKSHFLSYQDAFQMWEMYRKRASSKLKMPSIDKLESITNFYTRTRMALEYRNSLFSGSEQPQFISE